MNRLENMSLEKLVDMKNQVMCNLETLTRENGMQKRAFNDSELNDIQKYENELRALDEAIAKKEASTVWVEKGKKNDDIVMPGEKFEKRSYDEKNMELHKMIKGMMTGNWKNAENELEHYRSMLSSTNKVTIPQRLADQIVDVMRTQSAILSTIPTISMPNNNMKIAVQTKDAEAHFVQEGDLIPTSDAVFEGVDLEGKTLAVFVPISEQLLDSAHNLGTQLQTSIAKAIALALDKAVLYGEGTGTDHKIKGLLRYADIHKVNKQQDPFSYDAFVHGARPIRKSNIVPTDVAYSTETATALELLKDGNGLYIESPYFMGQYAVRESNNMEDSHIVMYNRDSLLLGIHKNIQIEVGTSGDQFQRIMKGIRVYLRADLGVINQKGVCLVEINPSQVLPFKEKKSK